MHAMHGTYINSGPCIACVYVQFGQIGKLLRDK